MMSSCNDREKKKSQGSIPTFISLNAELVAKAEKGMEEGVSGAYTGKIGDWLVWGGGCNFPSDHPSTKRYYKSLFAIKEKGDEQEWMQLTSLNQPSGYGASLLSDDGNTLYLIGGTDDTSVFKDIYRITIENGVPEVQVLDKHLPFGWYEGGAALVGTDLYLAGGWKKEEEGKNPLTQLVKFSLESGESEELLEMDNGARIQPVLFAQNNALYLYGGFRPASGEMPPHMQEQALKLDLNSDQLQWEPIANRPPSVTLKEGERKLLFVGSAVTRDPVTNEIYLVGGVDWDIFEGAVQREYNEGLAKASESTSPETLEQYDQARKDYLSMEADEYRFMAHLLRHNPENNTWEVVASDTAFATAGAAVTANNSTIYIVGGERKPRVRTPNIWKQELSNE